MSLAHYVIELLYDWQTIIAGLAAILGGWIAYRAGMIQAKATREAADKQITALVSERTSADAAAAEAICREIIECSKAVMEALRICGCIKSGQLLMLRKNAHSIMMNPKPIIYSAVAHRISWLPFDPQLVVSFYMRMIYIQQTIQIIVMGTPDDDSAPIPSEEAEILANSLIITCRLARGIIAHDPSVASRKFIYLIQAVSLRAQRSNLVPTTRDRRDCFVACGSSQ